MKSTIKIISGFLAVILLSSAISYSVVSMDLDPVTGFSVKQKGLTSQKFSWNKNEKAGGYKIYQKNARSDDYTLIKTIDSGDTTECEVKNLDMETYYTFKISAFKGILGFEEESDKSAPIKTCTLPRGESIKEITEEGASSLRISWSSGINCDGYEIEYALNKDFSDAKVKDLKSMTTLSCRIDNLKVGKTYCLRMRSYMRFENEKLYSEYSESRNATIKKMVADVKIDPKKPVIALTFDDGPDYNGASKKILDVLEKYNVRATFFAVGENAKNNPENIKRKAALGCEVGNHTYEHNHYGTSVTSKDISRCSDVIENIIGSRPTVFRSTGGMTTSKIKNECKREGMSLYYWSVDTEDWKYRNAKKVYKAAMKVKDGDIVLMHDIYHSTADAVKKIVPALLKKGYQFVTVSELIRIKTGAPPKSGEQYLSGTQTK